MESETYQFTVESASAGMRLDAFLAQMERLKAQAISRQRVQQLIEDGHVRCEDKSAKLSTSAKVKEGQRWSITIPAPTPITLEAEAIPLNILFEDEDMLVINKPAGMPVHPSPGHESGTLVHALLHHCGDSLSGIGGELRPGIVHRIDKDTSGLLAVAKHDQAHQHLSAQLKDRSLSRIYLAYCWGHPKGQLDPETNRVSGTVDAPIGRDPHHRKKMAVVRSGGKEARTHFKVLKAFTASAKEGTLPIAAKIECRLETGRTHQIRVHLHHLGCPLMGDPLYGMPTSQRLNKWKKMAPDTSERLPDALQRCNGQALHAHHISFNHPKNNEKMSFSCPLPEPFDRLENCLDGLA